MEIVRAEGFSFAYPAVSGSYDALSNECTAPAAPTDVESSHHNACYSTTANESAASANVEPLRNVAHSTTASNESPVSGVEGTVESISSHACECSSEHLTAALRNISFSVEEGAFCVLAGPTGCGKTTLLRCLKPELMPVGTCQGSLFVGDSCLVREGQQTGELAPRESAELVGFVMQDPDAQIVCDTVWHEMAFGLENIGMAQDDMRRRIAEVAHFFGIEPWMHARTEMLSGGQKQLANLAGVLALRPRLLLLDEPTAQLDPNARRQFLMMLTRVNRELGLTVIMATHAPEDVADVATQRIDLGEVGPLGRRSDFEEARSQHRIARHHSASSALETRDVYFRYERGGTWILRGVDACVREGSVHVFVGGNGCGKSTLLKLIAGVLKPQRGSVRNALSSSQAMLPQDPKALLVCDSVAEELAEWRERCGYTPDDEETMLERFGLLAFAAQHPYDLSGGQQQKLALAKLLLTGARLLMLDEPTKGLDAGACADVVRIVRGLADEGHTVIVVTHDLDFAFACADEVSMLFDGELACTQPVDEFFADNLVYRPNEESRLFGALL